MTTHPHRHSDAIDALIKSELAPYTAAIDAGGTYPQAFLQQLGRLGGFHATPASDGGGALAQQIDVLTRVAATCATTGFTAWCQAACAWYLEQAPEAAVRDRYLAAVREGTLLAGTGMSNTLKHLAGIEKIRLWARRDGHGYVVNGVLPWVSNLGPDHLVVVTAAVESGGYVMFALRTQHAGVTLHECPEFVGLRGSRTFNLRLKNVAVDGTDILATPGRFHAFIERIKPGFLLTQAALGLGVARASIAVIRLSDTLHVNSNRFLDEQSDTLGNALAEQRGRAIRLAHAAEAGNVDPLDALRLRAAASELALRAANAAVLHAGARGFLARHPAQRLLRGAVFTAIVTPALKHLRKEIRDLEGARLRHAAA